MLNEHNFKTWEEFENKLQELYEFRSGLSGSKLGSVIHFRGHQNWKWTLKTTLERFYEKELSLSSYYKIIHASKSRIESFTDKKWDFDISNILNSLREEDGLYRHNMEAYDYIVYLRHLGFPSPLLDWTKSPYIAAFFAFVKSNKENEYVSIYAYIEYTGHGKLTSSDAPVIHTKGEYVTTHKRHFLQQSLYTYCTKLIIRDTDPPSTDLYFANHEDVANRLDDKQDRLWKINIPVSEKIKVLKKLDEYNINAYSLFNSVTSLIDTIATKEFLITEREL